MADAPRRTDSGIEVKPLYGPADQEGWDYAERLGDPGQPPYTRGVYPTMYRGRPWPIRPYSGFGPGGAPTPRLGAPGHPPYTRGVYPTMYRGRPWTIRPYSGFGTAEATNQRFKYLLANGSTGLSRALDLPPQVGYDPHHPRSEGGVGKVGVAIDSIDDMRQLLDGIPLDKVTTAMTINATAPILLLLYGLVAEEQGVAAAEMRSEERRVGA